MSENQAAENNRHLSLQAFLFLAILIIITGFSGISFVMFAHSMYTASEDLPLWTSLSGVLIPCLTGSLKMIIPRLWSMRKTTVEVNTHTLTLPKGERQVLIDEVTKLMGKEAASILIRRLDDRLS